MVSAICSVPLVLQLFVQWTWSSELSSVDQVQQWLGEELATYPLRGAPVGYCSSRDLCPQLTAPPGSLGAIPKPLATGYSALIEPGAAVLVPDFDSVSIGILPSLGPCALPSIAHNAPDGTTLHGRIRTGAGPSAAQFTKTVDSKL